MTVTQEQAVSTADQQQGSHFYAMTVAKALRPGVSADYCISGTTTPPANWTRGDFFQWVYDGILRQHPELAGASVMYFTVDRNQL
ncbi:hypothetical protein ACGFZS_46840 [Streptomyces sp. NPDC048288]|uniref:hypothetical protein n=1 Tax=Streptomyces sp. NPDC048288 TaxID=3365529 RepID=UPI003717BEC5